MLASAGGMFSGTLLYVYLGAAGKEALGGCATERSGLEYVFFGVGLVVTIGVTIRVSRIAKKGARKIRHDEG